MRSESMETVIISAEQEHQIYSAFVIDTGIVTTKHISFLENALSSLDLHPSYVELTASSRKHTIHLSPIQLKLPWHL
jgi:hypothetical protein